MVKFLRLFLIVFAVSSLMSSCRKGPEDPLLSFSTRKNRLSNNWEAYSYRVNGVDMISEDKLEYFDINGCGKQTLKTVLVRDIQMDFSKNGNYTESRSEKGNISSTIESADLNCSVYNFSRDLNEIQGKTGVWSFTGGTNGTSSREQVFIYQEETKNGEVWDIVKLASDELKLKRRYIRPGESVFTTEEIFLKPR